MIFLIIINETPFTRKEDDSEFIRVFVPRTKSRFVRCARGKTNCMACRVADPRYITNVHIPALFRRSKMKMRLFPFIPLHSTFSVSVYLLSFVSLSLSLFPCLSSTFPRLFCFLSSTLSLLDSFYIPNHSWICRQLMNIVWKLIMSQC
jgi:hypothetical protein